MKICNLHSFGPYGNLRDKKVLQFIGCPLVKVQSVNSLWGGDRSGSRVVKEKVHVHRSHQESWSPTVNTVNKDSFDSNIGFITESTSCLALPVKAPVNIADPREYLDLASAVEASGVPNYKGMRVPLPSSFNLKYIEKEIQDYNDQILLDYLRFGFPLGINKDRDIKNNATENHTSAKQFPQAIDEYIGAEINYGALLGPFDHPPHRNFTWSPLMTRPKGPGRRVILDLSFGDFSVNRATNKERYDGSPFTLKLPRLEALIPTLVALGKDARLLKVDISRAFRNVRIDPGDALHLGICWKGKFFLDKNLAFGAVHGTAIFERITDLIRYILAKRGFTIYNYIDDIYACCHKDKAQACFDALVQVLTEIGLPINPKKVHPPCTRLSIMGIVVDVNEQTFSIENEKLDEIYSECVNVFVNPVIMKRDLQSLLGKLLYISRCVKGARIFLNRILQVYRSHHDCRKINPPTEFYLDIWWFINFLQTFNGIRVFSRIPVQHTVHVDATLTHVGGVWGSRAYSLPLPDLIQGLVPITQAEMFNIVVALQMWAHLWQDKVIAVRCDNEGAVYVCNTGKTRDKFLNICIQRIWHLTG